MGLTRAEQETVIRWDEDAEVVSVWSASPKTWRRMARLGVVAHRETTTGGKASGKFYRVSVAGFRWGLKRKSRAGAHLRRPGPDRRGGGQRDERGAARGADAMTNEQTTDTGPAYADRVLREAMLATTGGLDADQVATVGANILAPHARRRCLLPQVAIFGDEDVSIASGRRGDERVLHRARARRLHLVKPGPGDSRLTEPGDVEPAPRSAG